MAKTLRRKSPADSRYLGPKLAGANTGLTLVYLPVNMAWVFLFGTHANTAQPIFMGDHDMFFPTRAAAVAAAKSRGLSVLKSGALKING
jgi:hypothetical protein